MELNQRKDATFVAMAIATGVAQNLRWPGTPDSSINFEYSTLMVKFLADLLVADRSSSSGLHLIFLKALDKQEGVDRLISLFARYSEEAARFTAIPEANRDATARLGLIHAIGGLKVILGVFDSFTSHKTLLSPGHLLLLTQEQKSPSFFDPHAFLIKLRVRIFPAITGMWDSDFLAPSPPIIVRAVFRIMLHILEGQGESSEGGIIATPFPTGLSARQQAPNQAHVQILIDMGFPRSACEQALVRRNNNVQTAADYLMSHSEMVAAARSREAAQAVIGDAEDESLPARDAANNNSEENIASTPNDVETSDLSLETSTPAPATMEDDMGAESMANTTKGKEAIKKYSKADLDALRDAVKAGFISRALLLARDHGELAFDIRDALKIIDFKTSDGIYDTSRGLKTILKELDDILLSPLITSEEERSVTVRVRLVALIFSDTAFRHSADACYENAMAPVEKLAADYLAKDYETARRPKWLASIMLLAELILARSEMPQDAREGMVDTEDEANQPLDSAGHSPLRGPAFSEQRRSLFHLCLDVLRKGLNDKADFQSSMRLLLLLTRRHDVACDFIGQDGLPALMSAYDHGRKDGDSFQQYAIMILRHTVESKSVIKGLVERHVQGWLSRPRRSNDAGTYTRDLNAHACRDTVTFVEVTKELCNLIDGPVGNVIGKKRVLDTSANETAVKDTQTGQAADEGAQEKVMQIDDLTKALPPAASMSPEVDTVMHFLLAEATTATTTVLQSAASLPNPAPATPNLSVPADRTAVPGTPLVATSEEPKSNTLESASAVPASGTSEQPLPQTLQHYSYSTFLLTCIGELVASYMPCKLGLLSYSKRRSDPQLGSISGPNRPSKGKSQFLSYLLGDLVPTGTFMPASTIESKKRFALFTQAISVVVALCSDPSRSSTDNKEEPSVEMTNVRKAVLDALTKAFREVTLSSESVNAKYGRMSALCNMCSRLLAPPIPAGAAPLGGRGQSELSIQMAKLMLEKNFAVILTNALGEIDLNYPSVQNIINAVLSPLEHLTKLVTKIGRLVEKDAALALSAALASTAATASVTEELLPEEEEDPAEEDMGMEDDTSGTALEEIDHAHDHEADVYRNSALGMFEGELEPANVDEQYISGDEADEEMGEWDEGDEEMMDEEGVVPR